MFKYNYISPSLVENYLSVNGWNNAKRISGEVSIWESDKDNKQRVWVPLDSEFADYTESLERALSTLSVYEKRDKQKIVEDIEAFFIGDVLRIRSEDPLNKHAGTLPLKDGILLMKKARDIVVYGACSTENLKATHPTYRSETVKEYLDNVRIGQTERGSYIVKVISPLPKEMNVPEQNVLPHQEKHRPFERRVVETLMTALYTVKEIATELESKGIFEPEPFIESVEYGVSANLCESIARTDDVSKLLPLEVNVSWAYSAFDINMNVNKSVSIPTTIMPYIEQAGKALREKEPKYYEICGIVTHLHRESKLGPGSITVGTSIEGKPKSVHIQLGEADYDVAIQAHREGIEVVCSGEIKKDKKFTKLQDPTKFRMRGDDQMKIDGM